MSNILKVFEGIIDPANDFRAENLASTDAVDDYATNALNIDLTTDELTRVFELATDYEARQSAGEIISADDYYHDYTSQLVD